MYLDAQQQYSVLQALAGPGTVVSTNAIDHATTKYIGLGEPMVIVLQVGVAPAGGGTLTISLQTDTTSAFGAPVTVTTSAAIAAAALTLGQRVVLPIPNITTMLRWSRLSYVLATMTSITLTAWLALESEIQNDLYFPAGATVQ